MAKAVKKPKNDASNMDKHPDHQNLTPNLKRAQGQVEAVARMIAAREYCPHIIQQLRAASAALKALEASILQKHLQHCVHQAMTSKDKGQTEAKINEMINLFKKSNY
jgi:DNA-binding FrmR family transcriptional regulator